MNELHFTWDEQKNKVNKVKHKISFEEAKTVFLDENAVFFYDEFHSQEEERFLLLGNSNKSRLLFVCHCFREPNDTIRIISARKANHKEKEIYLNQ